MKRRNLFLAGGGVAGLALCIGLAGTTLGDQAAVAAPAPPPPTPPRVTGAAPFSDDFSRLRGDMWNVSSGWRVGNWMVNDWQRSQSVFNDGLTLTLQSKHTSYAEYSSGEIQSLKTYGHGYYQARLRAAPGSGLVTGFFTYTGPHYGTEWDEIDVEIIGVRPRKVQFTYFRNGKSLAYVHELDFDATAESHLYGFDWQPDKLAFYVDNKKVYEADGSKLPLPKLKQHIMFSLWGSESKQDWLGPFKPELLPTKTKIDCFSYSPSFEERLPCP